MEKGDRPPSNLRVENLKIILFQPCFIALPGKIRRVFEASIRKIFNFQLLCGDVLDDLCRKSTDKT